MSCEQIADELTLYLYGELSQDGEERVEQHLAACGGCTSELAQLRLFNRSLSAGDIAAPDALLEQCRRDLARSVRLERSAFPPSRMNRNWFERLQEFMNMGVGLRIPAGALALVAVGFLAGKIAPGGLPFLNAGGAGAQQAGFVNIRSVEPDASGKVHISFDNVARKQLSGSLDDPAIRELVLAGMKDDSNPGVRVEAVGIIKSHAADADVRGALLEAVQRDPNVGVRMSALEGLKALSADPTVRAALTEVLLNDVNPGVRVKVIDLLTAQKDDALVGPLQNQMLKEDNSYVRMRISNALREMNASVGTF